MSAATTMTAETVRLRSSKVSSRLTRESRCRRSSRRVARADVEPHSTTTRRRPSAAPAPAKPAPGNDAHLFDRLSILYKYRWAAIAVFALVVTWVMVDSYTRIPAYRATARVLVEDPNADVATPSEIARSVPVADPEMYMQTQLRIMKGRDLAQRVASKLDMNRVPEFNGQGPKPTQLAVTIAWVKFYAPIRIA